MRKKRLPSRIADAKSTVLVRRGDWEILLASVKTLVDTHIQLKRSRGAEVTRGKSKLRTKPRSRKLRIAQVIGQAEDQPSPQIGQGGAEPSFRSICLNCGREMLGYDKFCDRCGHSVG